MCQTFFRTNFTEIFYLKITVLLTLSLIVVTIDKDIWYSPYIRVVKL
jgi:hypothetical protein